MFWWLWEEISDWTSMFIMLELLEACKRAAVQNAYGREGFLPCFYSLLKKNILIQMYENNYNPFFILDWIKSINMEQIILIHSLDRLSQ